MHKDLEKFDGKLPDKLLKEIEEFCPVSKIKKVAEKVYEEYCATKLMLVRLLVLLLLNQLASQAHR